MESSYICGGKKKKIEWNKHFLEECESHVYYLYYFSSKNNYFVIKDVDNFLSIN